MQTLIQANLKTNTITILKTPTQIFGQKLTRTLRSLSLGGILLASNTFSCTTISARADTVYATIYSDNTIMQFTPCGAGSVFANTGLNSPQGLAFDSAGNLYVANPVSDAILKFSSTGTALHDGT